MEDVLEWVDNSLELFLLEENDLLLEVLISIFIFKEFKIDRISKESIGNNLFANPLIGTPIQDSGKRKKQCVFLTFIFDSTNNVFLPSILSRLSKKILKKSKFFQNKDKSPIEDSNNKNRHLYT